MSRLIRRDICGKEMTQKDKMKKIQIVETEDDGLCGRIKKEFDVCTDCEKEVTKLFKFKNEINEEAAGQ